MTRPAKNFAIGNGIIIGVSVNMVSLPRSHPCTTPITPLQFFSATLTYPFNYSPTRLYNAIWKSYTAPPLRGRGEDRILPPFITKLGSHLPYSPLPPIGIIALACNKSTPILSNGRWWSRIGVCGINYFGV